MWKIFVFLAAVAACASAAPDKIVCYYGSWAVYRPGSGKYAVENLDPNLCTHIIYGFVGINSDGSIRIMDAWNEVDLAALTRFNNLRNVNKDLKTLVAIGGWNEGSTTFSNVVSSPTLRANFIKSAVDFLLKWGFDGFDLDWEYPGQRGGAETDVANFSTLLAEFRAVFDQYGFLLTAAVAAAASSVDKSYDVPALSKYLDFINVMTYDLHGAWEYNTGHNSPLYASSIDTTAEAKLLNVDACIKGWIGRGAAPEKLVLGIGTYGRTFTLASSSNPALGAPTTGPGLAGEFTREAGFLGYNEICVKLKAGGWTVVRDNEQKVPYAYSGNQWVGYDDVESILLKAQYVKNNCLGGMMVWSVETDDFTGACGTVNPILNAMKSGLGLSFGGSSGGNSGGSTGGSSGDSSSSSTTTTTTTPQPPSLGGEGGVCTAAGYVRDPSNCAIFYYCLPNGNDYVISTFTCPGGLVFNPTAYYCDYPANVAC